MTKESIGNRKTFLLKYSKFPSLSQWKAFLPSLSKKEKISFFGFLFLFLGASIYLFINFYFENTKIIPAIGGIYREGIIGKPRRLNPLYAISDTERDLVEILFSGLMKYSPDGKIIPDLAEKYKKDETGKIYDFYLRENLFWSDGEPITADDIVFTIQALQNPAVKSPYAASWLEIEIEKINDRQVKFRLRNPYFPFLELATFGIIPKHIWQNVPFQNFPLAIYNLKPISSGPFKLKETEIDDLGYIESISLEKNPYYFGKGPFLEKIILSFHDREPELLKKALANKIDGFALQSPLAEPSLNFNLSRILLPRYFALFFNPEKSNILADKNIRKALNYATDKQEILKKVLQNEGKIVYSPLLPEIFNFAAPTEIHTKNQEKARELLVQAGFTKINTLGIREKLVKREVKFEFQSDLKLGSRNQEVKELQKCLARDPAIYPEGKITGYFGKLTKEAVIRFQEKYALEILKPHFLQRGTGKVGSSTRKKLNQLCARISEQIVPLKLELITVNQPQLEKVALLLKEQWRKIGIDLEVKTLPLPKLKQHHLSLRNYEILLFGQVLGLRPDLFPFWHSGQRRDPGLNLANYKNRQVDELLIKARQARDFQTFREKNEKLQDILIKDAPSVFLYTPFYLYWQSHRLGGSEAKIIADPSKRFSNVQNWYFETRRIWK